jgi:hypothetical protein
LDQLGGQLGESRPLFVRNGGFKLADRDPSIPSGSGQLGAIQAMGPFVGVEVSAIDARNNRSTGIVRPRAKLE